MLPTMGYFKDIECPYHNSSCGRPYCHFRHRKKNHDSNEEQTSTSTPTEVPTYKPTPKSQLASTRSHIPISYVPDVVIRSDRSIRPLPPFSFENKPTYKPTPLSVLSTVNKTSKPIEVKKEIDEGKTSENVSSDETIEICNIKSEPIQEDIACKIENVNIKTEDIKIENDETNKNDIDFEDFTNEFDLIDEILTDSNHGSGENNDDKQVSNNDESKDSTNHTSSKTKDKYKSDNSKSKEKKESSSKSQDSKNVSDKSKRRHSEDSKQKEKSHKSKSDKDKHSSNKSEKISSERSSSKSSKSSNEKSEKSSSKSSKSSSDKSCNDKHDRASDKDKSNKDKRRDSKDYSSERSSSRSHKHKSKDKDKEDKHKDKSDKEDKHKDKNEKDGKHRDKHEKHKDKSDKYNHKEKHSKSEKEKSSKNKKEEDSKRRDKDKSNSRRKSEEEMEIICEFSESEDEDDLEAECYRIFNEYKPTVPEYVPQEVNKSSEANNIEYIPTKKRIAYDKAESHISKITHTKPNVISNPAHVMANRLKLARLAQVNNEQFNIMNEVRGIKRTAHLQLSTSTTKIQKLSTTESKQEKHTSKPEKSVSGPQSTSIIDDILSSKSKPTNVYSINHPKPGAFDFTKPKPRIAPVQNVNSIQRAKAKIDQAKLKVVSVFNKTAAQSIGKSNKRVAHVPDVSLSDLPDVLNAERSKLPVNVRTRYLTTIADECIKLYIAKEEAYERALQEELKCYERCSALLTYRNSAMLCVNRIRKELQEREAAGLGPIAPGETPGGDNESQFKGRKFYESMAGWILTEEELVEHGYPRESQIPGRANIKSNKQGAKMPLEENQRICCRCSKIYLVDAEGFVLYTEECLYHPLKKRTLRGERTYLCCKSSEDTGCVTSNTHVSEVDDDRELEGYQVTMEPEYDDDPRSVSVYALDCEMCYTTKGLELTRVTVVDSECKTVYETLVKPLNPIIDYNTRFSGITKEQMDRTSTSILQVQANILHLCNSKTILIGHSLESDMKALKIIHSTVIDTSVLFPHKFGLPHKRALRALASEYLKKIIQNDINGHDSAEDAITCMELIIWKLKEELKVKGIKMK